MKYILIILMVVSLSVKAQLQISGKVQLVSNGRGSITWSSDSSCMVDSEWICIGEVGKRRDSLVSVRYFRQSFTLPVWEPTPDTCMGKDSIIIGGNLLTGQLYKIARSKDTIKTRLCNYCGY